jgi:hypothetical protein
VITKENIQDLVSGAVPGEWYTDKRDYKNWVVLPPNRYVNANGGFIICEIFGRRKTRETANMISAAPEMFELLKEIVRSVELPEETLEECCKVLAKASSTVYDRGRFY